MFLLVEILSLILIITLLLFVVVTIMIFHFLSDNKANVEAIFKGSAQTEADRELRDRRWEDRKWIEALPMEKHHITSYDGLKLSATYVRALSESDRCAICVHGFHSNGIKEFASIGRFYIENGINVLFVDQRASGDSEGRLITYGHREQRDLLDWIDYAAANLDENKYFSLHGISMGSATVTLVSNQVDEGRIKYIAADCGYTSEKEQLIYTIGTLKLPARLLYRLYSWLCIITRLYNPNKIIPIENVKKSRVPILFAHGKNDPVVPVDMAVRLHEACNMDGKRLVIADNAKHTQAFYYSEEYGKALLDMMFE